MSSTTEPPIIDVEALQASIDLQMSLLGEQVNASLESTLKNSKSRRSVSKSNALDTERKLQEYLKRPPRLGVGAPIPESSVAAREEAKLKNKIIGKRVRETDEILNSTKKTSKVSSDEEDTDLRKGGRDIKRIRVDPFSGSKRKNKPNANAPGIVVSSEKEAKKDDPVPTSLKQPITSTSDNTAPLALQLPKRLDMSNNALPNMSNGSPKLVAEVPPTANTHSKDSKQREQSDKSLSVNDTSNNALLSPLAIQSIPTSSSDNLVSEEEWQGLGEIEIEIDDDYNERQYDEKPFGVYQESTSNGLITENLRIPLLNLVGPPPSDTEDGEAEKNPISPKKKRRRRKKNKAQSGIPQGGD